MRTLLRWLCWASVLAGMLAAEAGAGAADGPMRTAADEIRREALRKPQDAEGWPLPLAASWNRGLARTRGTGLAGFDPDYQMRLIEQGHRLLPWFYLGAPGERVGEEELAYYETALKRAAQFQLPITFVSTQWESLLTSDRKYRDVPPDQDPNILDADGKTIRPGVDAFGPVGPWRDVGRRWTATDLLRRLQEWYPEPPRVIFLSNNEHGKLHWSQAETAKRYLDRYGKGKDGNFKRKTVGDGFVERYRVLQEGMREGLTNPAWKKNAVFIAYGDYGPAHFGRWGGTDPADEKTGGGWKMYSDYTPGRIDAFPLMWDGGSPSFYVHNWNPSTDYTVWSPQVEAMNWVFAQEDALRLNPNFWFEISVWDGCTGKGCQRSAGGNCRPLEYSETAQANLPAGVTTPVWPAGTDPSARSCWGTPPGAAGPVYSPARYAGMVQFGMWLLRPRVVREFRGYLETVAAKGPYFLALVEAVDRVYEAPALREFWQTGTLVPNRAHQHPYQADIPEEFRARDRWFLLDTNLDAPRPWTFVPPKLGKLTPGGFVEPPHPWEQTTKIPVFSLALVKGQSPQRRWLLYGHSPWGPRKSVEVTIPEYRQITVDIAQSGSFYLVEEKTGKATSVPTR